MFYILIILAAIEHAKNNNKVELKKKKNEEKHFYKLLFKFIQIFPFIYVFFRQNLFNAYKKHVQQKTIFFLP